MASFSKQEIQNILAQKDRWITLSTLDKEGFPHSVPLGYFLSGENVILGCRDNTQKVKNIERHNRVSLLWENGRGEEFLQGIMIRGLARIVRDDQERLKLKTIACRQRKQAPPTSVSPGVVYIEVVPVKTLTWNRPSRHGRSGARAES